MSLDHIRIVLVSPIYGGNVGSVCRAMANMGLRDLAIACPRDLDLGEARKMACAGHEILEARRDFPTLAAAVSDCGLVMGATARVGLYRQHAASPRTLAPRILEAADTGRVALVFGPEDHGLSNDDLIFCTHVIQIPSSKAASSLNLAHAVMLCCYEVFLASGQFAGATEKSPEAPSHLRERMFAVWRELLLDVGFMDEDKAMHMMFGVRRILARGKLTEDDVRIMMGIARQIRWKIEHGAGEPPDDGGADPDGGADGPDA
jgi:tRNA/rRNA methyltransferase